MSTHREFANYLQLVRLDSAAAELTIFCGALVGASLGFLWWNSYPAEIFMGDVGSLALGGALGTVALLIKQEFLLIIVGGVFVLEALSVIIQVGSFKSTGKRVFRMAPLHHHFELSRLERAEGHHPVPHRRDRLRPLQPDDVEAAMKATSEFSVRGKRVVVVGAARSGVAAAQLLVRRGATVTLSDVRDEVEQAGELRSRGRDAGARRPHRGDAQRRRPDRPESGCAARQPVIEAARAAGITVIGELELASRWLSGRIVAITGTKGKSTTTTLTGRMLEAGGHRVLVGGNIGHALSAQVDDSTADTIHVVEASSFQLESVETFHPWIAVLLNFSPDHLDRHASVEEYAAAKGRIFVNQTSADWVVLNADDEPSLAIARTAGRSGCCSRCRTSWWTASRSRTAPSCGGAVGGARPLVPLSSVRLLGRHLIADVMAAAAVASIAGVHAGGDHPRRRGLHRARACARTGGRDRRRAVRERFEGDERRGGAAGDRELRRRAGGDSRRPVQGRRASGIWRQALQARQATVVAIGEARELIATAFAGRVTVQSADDLRERREEGICGRAARRHGRARAGMRELRHVPRLRGARAGVQAGSAAAREEWNGTPEQ